MGSRAGAGGGGGVLSLPDWMGLIWDFLGRFVCFSISLSLFLSLGLLALISVSAFVSLPLHFSFSLSLSLFGSSSVSLLLSISVSCCFPWSLCLSLCLCLTLSPSNPLTPPPDTAPSLSLSLPLLCPPTEIACPENSHYELCGPACPDSCPSPTPPTTPKPCDGPCAEGCQCDSGFVWSADRCVPLDGGCGCWANGTYHEAGSEFWADATCSQRCHCGPGGGSLVCKPAKCGVGEQCALLPSGQHGCQPVSTAECQAWGDPHYVTLDGHRYDFQGNCEYLLSAPCNALPTGAENFTVTVVNEHRGSQAVSYTRSVTLHIYEHSLTLSAQWPQQLQVRGLDGSTCQPWGCLGQLGVCHSPDYLSQVSGA